MRRKVIAGNWKMNMLPNEAIEYIQSFEPMVKDSKAEIILCVPYTDLFYCLMNAQGTNIKIGAQNMHFAENGAYTGEISGKMLKSIGVEYVIIGHSERRQYFNETDETVNLKVLQAIKNDITPIVCVGETLEQFEANTTEEVVRSQTNKAFQNCCPKCMEKVVIAYEPVWAIGTGKTATNEIAETTCAIIRDEVAKMFGQETADKVRIQYGGSVKPEGIKALLEQPNIDGALVGGASLQPDSYIAMINNLG